jgi:hypothetical protein
MERVCRQCHAEVAKETLGDWCPACGGALVERASVAASGGSGEVDHRGIVLPRRHAVGGVITPQ